MSSSIYYRSLRAVSDAERKTIEAAAQSAEKERTWLSCEPANFRVDEQGYLSGGSKPNFAPDPQEAAAAEKAGLPDGTATDLIEVLGKLSREYSADWEITLEEGPPVGCIRGGRCDPQVVAGAEQLTQLAQMFARMSM
jgi:hypothetical protein